MAASSRTIPIGVGGVTGFVSLFVSIGKRSELLNVFIAFANRGSFIRPSIRDGMFNDKGDCGGGAVAGDCGGSGGGGGCAAADDDDGDDGGGGGRFCDCATY